MTLTLRDRVTCSGLADRARSGADLPTEVRTGSGGGGVAGQRSDASADGVVVRIRLAIPVDFADAEDMDIALVDTDYALTVVGCVSGAPIWSMGDPWHGAPLSSVRSGMPDGGEGHAWLSTPLSVPQSTAEPASTDTLGRMRNDAKLRDAERLADAVARTTCASARQPTQGHAMHLGEPGEPLGRKSRPVRASAMQLLLGSAVPRTELRATSLRASTSPSEWSRPT